MSVCVDDQINDDAAVLKWNNWKMFWPVVKWFVSIILIRWLVVKTLIYSVDAQYIKVSGMQQKVQSFWKFTNYHFFERILNLLKIFFLNDILKLLILIPSVKITQKVSLEAALFLSYVLVAYSSNSYNGSGRSPLEGTNFVTLSTMSWICLPKGIVCLDRMEK